MDPRLESGVLLHSLTESQALVWYIGIEMSFPCNFVSNMCLVSIMYDFLCNGQCGIRHQPLHKEEQPCIIITFVFSSPLTVYHHLSYIKYPDIQAGCT